MDALKKLRSSLQKVVTKKGKEKTGSASMAITESGEAFFGASVASDTHLLNFTSEQVALSCAKNQNNLAVQKVVTLLGEENDSSSLLIAIKVVVDFGLRIGKPIAYEVYNSNSEKVFTSPDARKDVPLYAPVVSPLVERLKVLPSTNVVGLPESATLEDELKKYAKAGVKRNLPTYDAASGYGCAVLLDNNQIVFGGQYGSYDNRLGMHAEMSVVLDALMEFPGQKITDLALVSTKYKDEPCIICGACLQFLAEMSERFLWNIAYHCFAFQTEAEKKFTLKDMLPNRWTSKNW